MLRAKVIRTTVFIGIFLLLKINGYASLTVHPQKLFDTIFVGGKSIVQMHIKNIGPSSSLNYQLSASESWITFDNALGVVNVNDSVTVRIEIDATQLNSGTYEANIFVGDPHHGPITIPISIFVQTLLGIENPTSGEILSFRVYPNPFYSTTRIAYYLSNQQNITIKLSDSQGNIVKTIVDEMRADGEYNIQLDGSMMPSGIYFILIKAAKFSISKVLFFVK